MLQLQVTRSHYPPDHWQDLKNGGGSQGLVTGFWTLQYSLRSLTDTKRFVWCFSWVHITPGDSGVSLKLHLSKNVA